MAWQRTERRKAIDTQSLLKSIVVNIHHHLSSFARHAEGTLSESFTKKGPGRKHVEVKKDKNGKPLQRWIPRQVER